MGGLYKRSICAVMTVLLVTMSLPGCLSLVYGREIMEGVRGEPEIDEDWRVYDLSHTFVLEGADAFSQIQESKTEQIEIDETVSEVVIIFKTSVNYHLGESDQRYVSVQLLWCDEFGSNDEETNGTASKSTFGSGQTLIISGTSSSLSHPSAEIATMFSTKFPAWLIVRGKLGTGPL